MFIDIARIQVNKKQQQLISKIISISNFKHFIGKKKSISCQGFHKLANLVGFSIANSKHFTQTNRFN
jgi:hypothetical protein